MLYKILTFLDKHRFYTRSFCVLVIWLTFADNNDLRALVRLHKKKQELQKELAYYDDKIKEVNTEYNEVLGNIRLKEKFAREKYFMKKPNEDVYVIVDENDQIVQK